MKSLMAALWAKIWNRKSPKKKLPEYEFQDSPMSDSTWVKIKTGIYQGVVYSYGMVQLNQDSAIPVLKFDYQIIHSGEFDSDSLQQSEEFVTMLGDILTDIIIHNEPTRENYTEESDLL